MYIEVQLLQKENIKRSDKMSKNGILLETKYETDNGSVKAKVLDVEEIEEYGDAEAVIIFDVYDEKILSTLLREHIKDEDIFKDIIKVDDFAENEINIYSAPETIEFLIYDLEKQTEQMSLREFVAFIFDELFDFDGEYLAQVVENYYVVSYTNYCRNVLGWDQDSLVSDVITVNNIKLWDISGMQYEDVEKDKEAIYNLYDEEVAEHNDIVYDQALQMEEEGREKEEIMKYIANNKVELKTEEEFFKAIN